MSGGRVREACTGALLVMLMAGGVRAEEQYIVVNIAPGHEYSPVFEKLQQMARKRTSDHFAPGIGAIFSYLAKPREECRKELTEFLSLAERFEMPVVVQLDGEQWWEARPDLWNWWDAERPGYDPANRRNVEWYGWDPDSALKIAWRDWGIQMRVLPPPNLMSPRYRASCHEEMGYFIPLILDWWHNLPEEKKHLLIGIKLGWESSIGVNAFYYPNGNALLGFPEENDPHEGLKDEFVPGRGVVAIGYAAVMTAHLANSGVLREDHLAEIVRRHLDDMCALAARLGVPRGKLFTHVGGWKEGELLYDAALNSYACPGWSFYRHAGDAAKDRGVQRVLKKSDAPYWGAVEWLLRGKHTTGEWEDALRRTLAIPKCRYVCIYNWDAVHDDAAAVQGIERVLNMPGPER